VYYSAHGIAGAYFGCTSRNLIGAYEISRWLPLRSRGWPKWRKYEQNQLDKDSHITSALAKAKILSLRVQIIEWTIPRGSLKHISQESHAFFACPRVPLSTPKT
jgi:hypothetical protein